MNEVSFIWEEEHDCVILSWEEYSNSHAMPLRRGDVLCYWPTFEDDHQGDCAMCVAIVGFDFANQTILAPLVNRKDAKSLPVAVGNICVERTIKANAVLRLIKNGSLSVSQVQDVVVAALNAP